MTAKLKPNSKPISRKRTPIGKPYPFSTFFDVISARLSEARKITLRGDVDPQMFGHLSNSIDYLASVSKEPINIELTTQGGSVQDGLAIYDKIVDIRKQGIVVNITTLGYCMSMGVPILQAATNRLSGDNSTFLLHEISYRISGTHAQNKDIIASTDKLNKKLTKILTARTNLIEESLGTYTERKDYVLDASEALELGLIDRII